MMPTNAQIEVTPAALTSTVADVIVSICREAFGDSLRALVVTGSMARNEISFLREGERIVLLSDVEAVVVLRDVAPLPARSVSAALCAQCEARLATRGVQVDVSLSVVHGSYLRNLPPYIYSYELRTCGQVIFGESDILEQIPAYSAAEVSVDDAWRLLSNRLIEQMEAEQADDRGQLRYRSIKLCLDLAASLLVFFGEFEAGYSARLERMEEFASSAVAASLPFSIHDLLPLVRQCTAAKLHPETASMTKDDFVDQIRGVAWRAWMWELNSITGHRGTVHPKKIIRAFGQSRGLSKRIRGWLFVARRAGWLSSVRYWPKWILLFARGFTPRHAIYLAAYEWQRENHEGDLPGQVRAINDLLPIRTAMRTTSAIDVSRQICWNYQEFVTETRA